MEKKPVSLKARPKSKRRQKHKISKSRKQSETNNSLSRGGSVGQGSSAKGSQLSTRAKMGLNGAAESRDDMTSILPSTNGTKERDLLRLSLGSQDIADRYLHGELEGLKVTTATESKPGTLGIQRLPNPTPLVELELTEESGRPYTSIKNFRKYLSNLPNIKRGPRHKPVDIAHYRLDKLSQHLARLDPHGKGFGTAKEAVFKAEVDYNYCLYYPTNTKWRPPPRDVSKETPQSKSVPRAQLFTSALWLLVKKNMETGTLQQVQDGTLVAAEIPRPLCRAMAYDNKQGKEAEQSDDQDVEMSISTDRSRQSSRDAEEMTINVNEAEEGHDHEDDDISEGEESQESVDPYPDNGDSGSEEGEVPENVPQFERVDAMHEYSNSTGATRDSSSKQGNDTFPIDGQSDSRGIGQILADLTPELLDRQLQYFHIGKLLNEIDLNLPTKCLTCGRPSGGQWHDSDVCVVLKCSNCGAHNKHLTIFCPTKLKCSKCREDGHNEPSCPYKLKSLSLDEITCELCRLKGHVESDCELVWRSSETPLVQDAVKGAQIFLSCYECGAQGHLGNDCPTRKPGKGLGSSSWTMFQRFDAPLTLNGKGPHLDRRQKQPRRHPKKGEKVDMKIKGLAGNQPSPSDKPSFLHPRRQPGPSGKEPPGKIVVHINPGAGLGLKKAAPPSQSISIKQPFGSYGTTQQPQDAVSSGYQNVDNHTNRGKEAAFVQYNHGNPSHDGQYERRRDRSRSPQGAYSQRNFREDRYQAGPPPTRNFSGGDVYRPMPSAARDAVRRHRM